MSVFACDQMLGGDVARTYNGFADLAGNVRLISLCPMTAANSQLALTPSASGWRSHDSYGIDGGRHASRTPVFCVQQTNSIKCGHRGLPEGYSQGENLRNERVV